MKAYKYASLANWSSATFSYVKKIFNENGANCYFITEGFDNKLFKPPKKVLEKKIDVIFVGSKSPKRENFIHFLKKNGIKVKSYGMGWNTKSLYLEELANKYKQSKITLRSEGRGSM